MSLVKLISESVRVGEKQVGSKLDHQRVHHALHCQAAEDDFTGEE